MMARLDSLQQRCLPQHTLSRWVGKLMNCEIPFVKNTLIHRFIRHYGVDLSEAVEKDFRQYKHFNDFFTRPLAPEARPIPQDPSLIICPNDGFVSQLGTIEEGRLFQAKGRHFHLEELLGGDKATARLFEEGTFATLYLSPKDYHRVHMPITGTLQKTTYIPGRLFAVKPSTVNTVPHLFARNERVVCLFETALGPMAVILVGALIVASIHTVWGGQLAPNETSNIICEDTTHVTLQKGEELGHFQLGSTTIVLFPKNTMSFAPSLHPGSSIRLGESLGQRILSA